MSRRLRGRLPTKEPKLTPKVVNQQEVNKHFHESKSRQKKYFDQGSKKLSQLHIGQQCRAQATPQGPWKPAAVVLQQHTTPRSYVVKMENGSELRRNRKHLLSIKEPKVNTESDELAESSTNDPPQEARDGPESESVASTIPTVPKIFARSGRDVKPSVRFKE